MIRRLGALPALLMLATMAGCDAGAPEAAALDATAPPPAAESVEKPRESAKALDEAGEALERSARPEKEQEDDAGSLMPDGS